MTRRLQISAFLLLGLSAFPTLGAGLISPPQPNGNLVPIVTAVAADVSKVDLPGIVATSASTHATLVQSDLPLTVAKADPWSYPDLTMVGALTISNRFEGKAARQSESGLASYTFTQIRQDGTPGESTTILFEKGFSKNLTLLAADPQEKGGALIVAIHFNFSSSFSLEHNHFLDQGQGTDWRVFNAATRSWSNWRSADELAQRNAEALAQQNAAIAQQNAALLQQGISQSSLAAVEKYADASTVNIPNSYGVTPLHLAIIGGHIDLVKALVEKGADVNALNGTRSPLTMATETDKTEIATYLQAHGAK